MMMGNSHTNDDDDMEKSLNKRRLLKRLLSGGY